jgi:hypothetical protein
VVTGAELFGCRFSLRESQKRQLRRRWSAHIELEPAAELELTFVKESWASIDPVDAGTGKIVTDALKVLIDKDGALERLRHACS